MAGGLMQLVAYGAQDVYLTGNPQITFFKSVYRRHTNFAIEAIDLQFNGTPALGSKAVVPITRHGDLVTKMYLKTTVNKAFSTHYYFGYEIIDSVELQIGGTKIDKQYGRWMYMWTRLTNSDPKTRMVQNMITPNQYDNFEIFVPLHFFCCRHNGLALPLIALQYHDVRLEFNFTQDLLTGTDYSISNTSLLVDYIYLDSEERKRFAQASHEYLIEQVQFTGVETPKNSGVNNFHLNFNHPVKELFFAQPDAVNNNGTLLWTDYEETAPRTGGGIESAILQLNGHERFSQQSAQYFNMVQPYQHHTNYQGSVCVYSFALNPEEHQPSGTCNFSRIDNATLILDVQSASSPVYIYAMNYNVLRVMSGMGGLAYSN